MRRTRGLIAVLAIVIGLEVWQAIVTPTFALDEPLWFTRSHWTSAGFHDPDGFFYAVDVPGLNRWVYWPLLKITGLDKVGPDEPLCWSLRDGRIYFQGQSQPFIYPVNVSAQRFAKWVRDHGSYAPRSAVMALRYVNIAVYAVMLVALWWTANAALKSSWLAVLAVAPVALVPGINSNVAFVSWSGDIWLLAMQAVTLAVWTRFHLRNAGSSWTAVTVVGILCGVAVSAKLSGFLVLAAYCLYLAIVSRGAARLAKPVVACVVAFAVFSLINPIILGAPGMYPWQVIEAILRRRGEVVVDYTARRGPLGWTGFVNRALFWWPLAPVAIWAFWKCRHRAWFLPVAAWCGVLVAGTVAGITQVNRADYLYLAPLDECLFFPVALAFLSLGVCRDDPAVSGVEREGERQV